MAVGGAVGVASGTLDVANDRGNAAIEGKAYQGTVGGDLQNIATDGLIGATTAGILKVGGDSVSAFRQGLNGSSKNMSSGYLPNEPLPQQRVNDVDIPLSHPHATGAHTTIGSRVGSDGVRYRQTATFPDGTWPLANGQNVPWSRVDWHNHGRPWDHATPHQHIFSHDGKNWKSGPQTLVDQPR